MYLRHLWRAENFRPESREGPALTPRFFDGYSRCRALLGVVAAPGIPNIRLRGLGRWKEEKEAGDKSADVLWTIYGTAGPGLLAPTRHRVRSGGECGPCLGSYSCPLGHDISGLEEVEYVRSATACRIRVLRDPWTTVAGLNGPVHLSLHREVLVVRVSTHSFGTAPLTSIRQHSSSPSRSLKKATCISAGRQTPP